MDPKNTPYLPPEQALDEQIRRAMDNTDPDGGALRPAYDRWFSSEYNRLALA